MAKIIFRRIGGILRPIRIGSSHIETGSFKKIRAVTAKLLVESGKPTEELGKMYLGIEVSN